MTNRGPSLFKQTAIRRAVRGATSAGLTVSRVEITAEGKIILVVSDAGSTKIEPANPWDEVLGPVKA
jgi:hypothetical protein